VPGELDRNRKFGTFPPRLHTEAVESGIFSEDFAKKRCVRTGYGARYAAKPDCWNLNAGRGQPLTEARLRSPGVLLRETPRLGSTVAASGGHRNCARGRKSCGFASGGAGPPQAAGPLEVAMQSRHGTNPPPQFQKKPKSPVFCGAKKRAQIMLCKEEYYRAYRLGCVKRTNYNLAHEPAGVL
jgi:hypothetical protein